MANNVVVKVINGHGAIWDKPFAEKGFMTLIQALDWVESLESSYDMDDSDIIEIEIEGIDILESLTWKEISEGRSEVITAAENYFGFSMVKELEDTIAWIKAVGENLI